MSEENRAYVGLEPVIVSNIAKYNQEIRTQNFDFLLCDLAHPRFNRDFTQSLSTNQLPFTRSDTELSSFDWNRFIVGKISSWINVDSEHQQTRYNSEKALQQEFEWAAHLGLSSIMLPVPNPPFENYARFTHRYLLRCTYLQMWIRIPLSVNPAEDTWQWWNSFRCMTNYHERLFPALQVGADVPEQKYLDRWFGEPLRAIILPTSIFLTNRKGYPTLSLAHQKLVKFFSKLKLQFIISGSSCYDNGHVNYQLYIAYIVTQVPKMSDQERFESPFYDYLQAPLQPLMDNLESQTYETFERDPVKYERYKQAVQLALEERKSEYVVMMVVGAGRGPLVSASIEAARLAGHTRYKIYAVEKNPNAIVTLRNKYVSDNWEGKVFIVDSDMRFWNAPEQADILISELLGSFGDNELSPECLDGAQRFLKPTGISIPQSYTSYLVPISAQKIWTDVNAFKDLKHFETSYVVKAFNSYIISPAQEVFTFTHPNRSEVIDNNRYKKLKFKADLDVTMHGCLGYFSSVLYKDVNISILPATYSHGMFSWFPIFFPLRFPGSVKAGEEIEVEMWRVCADKKVWYEWNVSKPFHSTIHNANGRSHWIGL